MHSVARLALHPYFRNIQVSWVKMGPEGLPPVPWRQGREPPSGMRHLSRGRSQRPALVRPAGGAVGEAGSRGRNGVCLASATVSRLTKQCISARAANARPPNPTMGCIWRASWTGFVPLRSFCSGSMIACKLAEDGDEYHGFDVCAVDEDGNEIARMPIVVPS